MKVKSESFSWIQCALTEKTAKNFNFSWLHRTLNPSMFIEVTAETEHISGRSIVGRTLTPQKSKKQLMHESFLRVKI